MLSAPVSHLQIDRLDAPNALSPDTLSPNTLAEHEHRDNERQMIDVEHFEPPFSLSSLSLSELTSASFQYQAACQSCRLFPIVARARIMYLNGMSYVCRETAMSLIGADDKTSNCQILFTYLRVPQSILFICNILYCQIFLTHM